RPRDASRTSAKTARSLPLAMRPMPRSSRRNDPRPPIRAMIWLWRSGRPAMLRARGHRQDGAPRAMDFDVEALTAKLAELKSEHRDLDDVIARLAERAPFDQLQLQRLKKRKLALKDQIAKIESELLPDIIA